jgi:hypothetical protein
MSDPLSFLILGSGVAAMASVGYEVVKGQTVTEPLTNTPNGVTKSSKFQESQFIFNDASTGPSTLWSAAKIKKSITGRQGMPVPVENVAGNIVLFGLQDSKVRVDDSYPQDPSVLWSSIKAEETIASYNKDKLGRNTSNQNIAIFDSSGSARGSNTVFDDSLSNVNVVWSAEKISALLNSSKGMKRVPGAKLFAEFDSAGQVVDSQSLPATSLDAMSTISSKFSNKMSSVVAPIRHFASANSNGTISDSDSFVDSNQTGSNVLWPALKIQSSISDAKNSMNTDITKKVADSEQQFIIDPLTIPSTSAKMSLHPQASAKNISVFNSSGQIVDSEKNFNDFGVEKTDIWSAFKIKQQLNTLETSNLSTTKVVDISADLENIKNNADESLLDASKKMNLVYARAGNVGMLDSNSGNLKDGGFVLDDGSAVYGKTFMWSSKTIANYLAGMNKNTQSQISSLNSAAKNLEAILSGQMSLVPDAVNQNVAIFDSAGQLIDSRQILPKNAVSISTLLNTKTSGSGTLNALASWSSQTSLKSSGVVVSDDLTSANNVWTSQGVSDQTSVLLSPYTNIDSQKSYFFYKIENYSHPGPAFLNPGTANYINVPVKLVESNVTVPASRLAYFRCSFFGAVQKPESGYVSFGLEGGTRQDTFVPANAIVPCYISQILKRTIPYIGFGMAVNPAPATILFGYISIVEL